MEVDILDFDKTIVPFDSGSLFIFYCMIHYPWCVIYLPVIAFYGILTLFRVIDMTQYKKTCFGFIRMINVEKAAKKFWDKHEKQVFSWFKNELPRKKVVISASPDFLLNEIKDRIGMNTLICSRHDKKNGKIIGENCRGSEKVRRFEELFDGKDVKVIDVYSDSIFHDKYIFSLASNNCFQIKNGNRIKFNYNEKYKGEN